MIQGTTSDAGKSTLVTGLCRLLQRKSINVVPFKPQNMALNSAVTIDDGEIGRAQAVQAQACLLEPHSDMNPVLLKPNSDKGAQVIIHGKALTDMDARGFHDYKKTAMQAVLESYQRLQQQYDVIMVEGAGSPAEINLRENDIANMGFAEAVDCPVLIAADIDRGGVFAHLYGTLALLSESEQNRIKGFIINRFRGDVNLLLPGNDWLHKKTNKPVLGVVPYLHNLHLEAEDAIETKQALDSNSSFKVIIPVFPRISNHTDFDALRLHPQINLEYIKTGVKIPYADLIILPGSKSVRDDLQWLKRNGWQSAIEKHLRYGGKLLGICGGYQMLGAMIDDPNGIEGAIGSEPGLGLFNFITTIEKEKQLHQVQGVFNQTDIAVTGYEIHAGITRHYQNETSLVSLNDGRVDGVISLDNQIMGSYLHGIFEQQQACQYLLKWAGLEQAKAFDYLALQQQGIDLMADTLDEALDVDAIMKILSV